METYGGSDLVTKILLYIELQMPVPKTPESEERRWARKAVAFQEQFEKSNPLCIFESKLRRYLVARWRDVSGEKRIPINHESETTVRAGNAKAFLRNLKKNGIQHITLKRVWMVVEYTTTFSTEPREIQRWERLIMAKAHRDARNFHYTKWLMTKDMDAVSNELSGGMKR